MSPRPATPLNLFVLRKHVEAGFPTRVSPADHPHLARCIRAGLLMPAGRGLTPAGVEALTANPEGGAA